MRVYLLRHGQTAWNAEGRAQGHTDIPLDADGLEQARLVGLAFANLRISRVWTSDLARARDTAMPIVRATGAALTETPLLRERGFGDFEGKSFIEVQNETRRLESTGLSAFEIRLAGGESFRDVWNRLDPIADELFATREDVAVVTHGGSCALLLAKLLHGNIETCRAFRFGNTAITELERRPDGLFLMVRYNETAHLTKTALAGDTDGSRS